MIVHDFEDIAKALGKLLEEKQRAVPNSSTPAENQKDADAADHLDGQMGYDYCC